MGANSRRAPRRVRADVALAILGVLALLGATGACTSRTAPAANADADTRIVLIPVEGMSCAACAARVKKALIPLAGVSDVEVSLVERRVRVCFDPARLASDRLVAAINGLGYRAGTPTEAQ